MKANWHILTVTRGGTVSLLKNLTEEVARQTMQRLRMPFDEGDPWSDWQISKRVSREISPQQGGWQSYMRTCQPGDLERIDCFGPEGVELVVWPKPDDYEERYAAALAKAKEAVAA